MFNRRQCKHRPPQRDFGVERDGICKQKKKNQKYTKNIFCHYKTFTLSLPLIKKTTDEQFQQNSIISDGRRPRRL
jgi:hypothetical protein